MKHTWIFALIGGLAVGGAAGTYAGAKIMYERNRTTMAKVEEELNNLLFELKEEKKETTVTGTIATAAEMEISTVTVPNEFVSNVGQIYSVPVEHTPAFKTSTVYTIPFDDFETEPEFESEVLFYYPETGDVTDDQHVPIGKAKLKELIGEDALTHFDEYEEDPDCVRVKNDTLKTYYEILRYYTSP